MESASSNKKGSSNVHLQKKQRTEDDETRPAMLDFDVLDCPVCYEPFTIPIYQCNNGHLACSSCCPKLSNKCPSCALPVGLNRCRVMESVLDSIFIPCRNAIFGCTKKVSYGKESSHDKECTYSQCLCPVSDFNHTCSYRNLYYHCSRIHSTNPLVSLDTFTCGNSVSVQINISDKILIKRERRMRLLFALQCFREPCGVYVTVSCIAPSAPEVGEFSCCLSYTVDEHVLIYVSPKLKRILEVSAQKPEESFMLIRHSLLRGDLLEISFVSRMRSKCNKP